MLFGISSKTLFQQNQNALVIVTKEEIVRAIINKCLPD
jgi:hypothetical protein